MIVKHIKDIPVDPMDVAIDTDIQWLISPVDGEEKIGVRRFIIRAGGSIPPHRHKELYHIQYVIKGRYKVGAGGREYEVEPGSVIYIPPGEVHWYRNESNEDVEFLCIIPLDVDGSTEVVGKED